MITPKRFYFIMIGLNCICVILIFLAVLWGNGLIKNQSEKLRSVKTESRLIDEQQISLLQAKKDIEKYSDLNKTAQSIVPQDKDQAKTVREISKIASETGVALKDIKFQSSNLGQTVVAPTTTTPTEGSTTPAKPALPPISQVKPIDGISGVFALEIIITSQDEVLVTYPDFIKFLERLETNRRTAHVDKISIKPSATGDSLSFTLTLNAYVKP
jgi:hypothetical protein